MAVLNVMSLFVGVAVSLCASLCRYVSSSIVH